MTPKFYIDRDLKSGKLYIAPSTIVKTHLYLILIPDLYNGEKILKALIIGKIKSPLETPKSYKMLEAKEEHFGSLSGVVYIYEFIGKLT
ncbi:MAG: hypothetical protein U0T83_08025 [Bacteriovoracaceae bacterium]